MKSSVQPPQEGFMVFAGEGTSRIALYEDVQGPAAETTGSGEAVDMWTFEQYWLEEESREGLAEEVAQNLHTFIKKGRAAHAAALAGTARARRDALLAEIDTVYCNPANWELMEAGQKLLWQRRKQFLRDVPAQAGFPGKIDWGKNPALVLAATGEGPNTEEGEANG